MDLFIYLFDLHLRNVTGITNASIGLAYLKIHTHYGPISVQNLTDIRTTQRFAK